ncbi:calcium-responsive transactivator-like isoform X3 [Synchiropus splendidus]|uniref:calcium-responsive transactivator-like isoform X3 n=1 Tax=Synchiropus splendidus TaxID=270530 RepID=UPI00237E8331|nr:calcium-responsive transactivator-like isoform X3 [Synchiropus splendidus]
MSVPLSPARPRSRADVTPQAIQKMLDENHQLIQCIMEQQSKGKTADCAQYQQLLHRNLVYLATMADSNQNIQSLLPAPPSSNMGGGFSASNMNDSMLAGVPPASMIPSQLSNASMLHQQSGPHCSAAQAGALYPGQSVMAQGSGQRSTGTYRATQGPGEFSYQQCSYGEQGYERPYDDSSHYYEGGNPQYSQQPAAYQPPSQQPFASQGYSGQGYGGSRSPCIKIDVFTCHVLSVGPGQSGSLQYSHYPSAPNQQYGSYRGSGSGPQAPRSYTYEQGQYGNYQQ